MLRLAELIKKAQKHNDAMIAYVYGDIGAGKTSYALHVAKDVLGSWNNVLDYLFFSPREAIEVMEEAIYNDERLPIIIMDDAGLWLDKLTWWMPDKVAFMKFFNLIRSVTSGVIFTTPSEELPKQILKKCKLRVKVRPMTIDDVKKFGLKNTRQLMSVATIYRRVLLPNFYEFFKKTDYEVYPTHYPDPIYQKYEEMRKEAVKEYFEEWKRTTKIRGETLLDEIASMLRKMSTSEVAKELMRRGIPKTTAYRYIKKAKEVIGE